jgi:alpha-galactosidase
LDPEKNYRIRELNLVGRPLPFEGKVFSGKFLMETGLNIPDRNYGGGTHRDFASHVLYLVAE